MDLYYNYHKKETFHPRQISGYDNFSDYRKRQESKLPFEDYSFLNFMAYIFYLPLYLAGPICCYNAFISFLKRPQEQYDFKKCVIELLKVISYFIILEVILHYSYICAISRDMLWSEENQSYWKSIGMNPMSAHEIFVISCHYNIFMFLKFLVIWRVFRVFALFDGFNPPDNMLRCLYNVSSFQDFWRHWHSSLYHWILRYIYSPLGGKYSKIWSIWIIYTFIAIWHDLQWKWFIWAIFNCCCIIIEALLESLTSNEKFKKIYHFIPFYFLITLFINHEWTGILSYSQFSLNAVDIFKYLKLAYFGPGAWSFIFLNLLPFGMILAFFQAEYRIYENSK